MDEAFGACSKLLLPLYYPSYTKINLFRKIRAKLPRFEAGFSYANVQRVVETLQQLDYHGPLALSWDDTDMEKALSIWQASQDSWVVLGAKDGMMLFNTLEDVDRVFDDDTV